MVVESWWDSSHGIESENNHRINKSKQVVAKKNYQNTNCWKCWNDTVPKHNSYSFITTAQRIFLLYFHRTRHVFSQQLVVEVHGPRAFSKGEVMKSHEQRRKGPRRMLSMNPGWLICDTYNLEPTWHPFWVVDLPFCGSNLPKYGSFGFLAYIGPCLNSGSQWIWLG